MPTLGQLQVIHKAARDLKLIVGKDDAAYRLVLLNVGGVASAKQLDNVGVEEVMAFFEDRGFNRHPGGETYWRDKVRLRTVVCGERMYRKILALAEGGRYDLGAMVARMCGGATDDPALLQPQQAWQLIEALKAINDREGKRASATSRQGSLFPRSDAPARRPGRGTDAPLKQQDPPRSEPGGQYDDEVPF